jgi:hypothetical protein
MAALRPTVRSVSRRKRLLRCSRNPWSSRATANPPPARARPRSPTTWRTAAGGGRRTISVSPGLESASPWYRPSRRPFLSRLRPSPPRSRAADPCGKLFSGFNRDRQPPPPDPVRGAQPASGSSFYRFLPSRTGLRGANMLSPPAVRLVIEDGGLTHGPPGLPPGCAAPTGRPIGRDV